ncbi:MAG: hypothetical protein WDZ46_05500, partial [Solirubrobacterales bacterium]
HPTPPCLIGCPVGTGCGGDVLCVRVADFDRNRFRVDEQASTLRRIDTAARRKCLLQSGDVLIEKSGGGEAQPVGFAVAFDLGAAAVCSNFIARLRPKQGVEPAYAALVLAASYRAGCNMPFVKQTTGIQNLDLHGYLSIHWVVPGREMQISICNRLQSEFLDIDHLLSTLDEQMLLLGERRQALITAAVTGQVDIPEAS